MQLITYALVGTAVLLRAAISLHPYSGQDVPPMFGDFEAQRHWQEITVNLPVGEWYHNTPQNDLLYWGLDYPPLTAYHSLVNGLVGRYLNESYVALYDSRGISTSAHKDFMRATVLAIDIVLYVPVMLWLTKVVRKVFERTSKLPEMMEILHAMVVLFYPGQILIDNGHFQYNNVSLGLAALAVAFFLRNRALPGAVAFVLALNYKQMELYHAFPVFFYLLAHCFRNKKGQSSLSAEGLKRLTILGVTVVAVFAVVWLPFLRDIDGLMQVVHRIFPIARGVFEDKVANIWCAINVFVKLKENFTNERMAMLCLSCTLAAVLPTCLHLFARPTKRAFLLSLVNCSLAFFLMSFQVHEKSILLVTFPAMLLFPVDPVMCMWLLQIATFSMLPLFVQDNLLIGYVALNVFYAIAIKLVIGLTTVKKRTEAENPADFLLLDQLIAKKSGISKFLLVCFYISMLGQLNLTGATLFVTPPTHLPHLFPLLNALYACGHFVFFFLYFTYRQLFAMY